MPVTAPLKTIGVIATPEHFVWLDGVATAVGVGLTIKSALSESSTGHTPLGLLMLT